MFDLATAIARYGVTDPADQVLLDAAMIAAKEIVEEYLNRKLDFAEAVTETHVVPRGAALSVDRYPIESVEEINIDGNGTVTPRRINKDRGTISLQPLRHDSAITVTYSGGFKEITGVLELALWGVLDVVFPEFKAPSSEDHGAIKSVVTPDVGTISYYDLNVGMGGGDIYALPYGKALRSISSLRRDLA